MTTILEFIHFVAGFVSLILLVELVLLKRRHGKFNQTRIYTPLILLFGFGAIFFTASALAAQISPDAALLIHATFYPLVFIIGAVWLGGWIRRIKNLPPLPELERRNAALQAEIEQRKATEALLRAQQETLESKVHEHTRELEAKSSSLEALINASPLAIAAVDDQGRVRLWNPAAERLFGWSRQEVLGQPNFVIPEECQKEYHEIVKATLNGQGVHSYDTTRQHKNGTIIKVCMWSIPINMENGARWQSAAIFEDTTERRKATEALARAKITAEQANLAKTAFLANMSHEIRTPLSAIIGFAGILKDGVSTPEEQRHYCEVIDRNGALLNNLISDILDVSKIEAGEMQFEKMPIELRELMDDVTKTLSFRAREKGIALVLHVDDGVPARVMTDPTRLKQILLNVIGNAVKFTQKGYVAVTVTRDAQPLKSKRVTLRFNVRDTGPGMTPEEASRLFRPFTQIDASVARKFGGTGLGLYLSQKMARALDGDVVLRESQVDSGSSFEIHIEATALPEVETTTLAIAAQPPFAAGAQLTSTMLIGRKVLLVEDTPDNQELICHLLQEAGARVDVAADGIEAVHKAMAQYYDLVLMDLQMPRMNGYEATARLRANGFAKPIIAVSAYGLKGEQKRCLAAGCNAYLGKPFAITALIDSIGQQL